MNPGKYLTGEMFSNIRVLGLDHYRATNMWWKCECVDCGTPMVLRHSELNMYFINHCPNCGKKAGRYIDAYKAKYVHATMRREALGKCYRAKNTSAYFGVGLEPEWQNFQTFTEWLILNDYGSVINPAIYYDKSGKPVGPDTMTVADMATAARSYRTCKYLTYNGETKTILEWSRISGISTRTLLHRMTNIDHSDDVIIFAKPYQKPGTPIYDHEGNFVCNMP